MSSRGRKASHRAPRQPTGPAPASGTRRVVTAVVVLVLVAVAATAIHVMSDRDFDSVLIPAGTPIAGSPINAPPAPPAVAQPSATPLPPPARAVETTSGATATPVDESLEAAIMEQRRQLESGTVPMLGEAPPADPVEGAEVVTFSTLGGFRYVNAAWDEESETPAERPPADQIPASVRQLNGRTVVIRGFMVPTIFENDGVLSFILVKDQMLCCFGVMPKMNEWIDVRMAEGHRADFFSDRPVTVMGRLEVGEEYEEHVVLSVYRLEATSVKP